MKKSRTTLVKHVLFEMPMSKTRRKIIFLTGKLSKTRRKTTPLADQMLKTRRKITFLADKLLKTRYKINISTSQKCLCDQRDAPEAPTCIQGVQNRPSGTLLGPSCGQGMKMSKIDLMGPAWGHLVAKARKCLKSNFWGLPGAIWWPRHEHAQNRLSGVCLGSFSGQGTKIVKIDHLGPSWDDHLVAKA